MSQASATPHTKSSALWTRRSNTSRSTTLSTKDHQPRTQRKTILSRTTPTPTPTPSSKALGTQPPAKALTEEEEEEVEEEKEADVEAERTEGTETATVVGSRPKGRTVELEVVDALDASNSAKS